MKKYSLIKTRDGHRTGTEISYFFGDNENDPRMIAKVQAYLFAWLNSYNNSIPDEEMDELFANFDGRFNYDVWTFTLEEKLEKTIKVNKLDYYVFGFLGGYYGICKINSHGGECVHGGDSANEDDYNEEYINSKYENWDGTLHLDKQYGYKINV